MAKLLIDPADPRPTYVRIAEQLRTAYEPGVQLPSTPKLAEEWGVAKETIRAAIDVLRQEGLVVSWQGRGTYYKAPSEDAPDADSNAEVLRSLDAIMNRLDEFEDRLSSLERAPQPEADP
ncbi:winged helix-turn-helix domain-containing protein [Nocardia fluminea]|uniref:winged helix-turn-helix domain-containing protein n=1 Tax=Nocardia fluminea TaxID=134984 RepID=UPI0037223AFC